MDSLYFDNVIQIGKLYLDYIFYEFESEPILFSCVDEQNNLYFCLCSDIRYGQRWVIIPRTITQMEELIEDKCDIASAFLSAPNIFAIDMDLEGNEKSRIIDKNRIDRLDFPKEGTYVKCNKEQARIYLWNKKWETFSQQLKLMLDPMDAFDAITESYKAVINSTGEFLNRQTKECRDSLGKMLKEQIGDLIDTISQSLTVSQEYSVEIQNSYSEASECGRIIEVESDDYIQAA